MAPEGVADRRRKALPEAPLMLWARDKHPQLLCITGHPLVAPSLMADAAKSSVTLTERLHEVVRVEPLAGGPQDGVLPAVAGPGAEDGF